jgi:hypothetical protein
MDNSTAEPVILAMDCDPTQLKNIGEMVGKIIGGKNWRSTIGSILGRKGKKWRPFLIHSINCLCL